MTPKPKRIAILLPPSTLGMSFSLIQDLCLVSLTYAAELSEAKDPDIGQVALVSEDGKPVALKGGALVQTTCLPENVPEPDCVFICAFWGGFQEDSGHNTAILKWLKQQNSRNVPIAAISNAPFFPAQAGLLDGHIATVYPPVAKAFSKRFPKVDFKAERAITNAGNIYCADGIASGCDLIVSIIELLLGPDVSRRLRQDFLIGFNRNYALSHVQFDGQKYHRDHQILTIQSWLESNFDRPVIFETLAANYGMSTRTLARRFQKATGEKPSHYLQRIRIEAAKDLLRSSKTSVSEVAYRVGYSSHSHFSRIFQRLEGCMPKEFRAQSQ